MAPLIFLISVFIVLYLFNRVFNKSRLSASFMGRAAMAFMLLFTGMAHFTRTEQMIAMLPAIVPFKEMVVQFTGFLEIILALGLIYGKSSRLCSILLILFFISVLPANIVGSLKRIALGGMEHGPSYLFFRIPLQAFFIGWVYYFGIRINVRKI